MDKVRITKDNTTLIGGGEIKTSKPEKGKLEQIEKATSTYDREKVAREAGKAREEWLSSGWVLKRSRAKGEKYRVEDAINAAKQR